MHIIDEIEASEVFKVWRKEHEHPKLAHVFVLYQSGKFEDWQAGYAHNRQVTSFKDTDGVVEQLPTDEAFNDDKEVLHLDREAIKISAHEAVAKAKEHQEEKYPAEFPQRIICICQNIDGQQMWNITFLTIALKTLNIKLDAATGNVISSDMVSFFDMRT